MTPEADHATALAAVDALRADAERLGDAHVVLLSLVLRTRVLVDTAAWSRVHTALSEVETSLGLSYDADNASPGNRRSPRKTNAQSPEKGKEKEKEQTFITFDDPFEAAMAVHVLIMAVVCHTHEGNARSASTRLTHLHALLDSDVLDKFPDGVVEVRYKSIRADPVVLTSFADSSWLWPSADYQVHTPTYPAPPWIPCEQHLEAGCCGAETEAESICGRRIACARQGGTQGDSA